MIPKNVNLHDFIRGTLPDWAIRDYIKQGVIKIENLDKNWEEDVDPVTIDFHLGSRILFPVMGRHVVIDIRRGVDKSMYEEIDLKEGESITIRPGQFLIAETREILTLPNNIIGRLEGKSGLARLGIVVHQTSARFDPGWSGAAALELRNNSENDVIIYCGDKICAFSFEKLTVPVEHPYQKKTYQGGKTLHSMINNSWNSKNKKGKKK